MHTLSEIDRDSVEKGAALECCVVYAASILRTRC